MQILARSPRLWLTFCAVVLLFAVTGPYGSAERLAFLPRLGYWLLLHAGAWSFALAFSVIADVILQAKVRSMFVRMLIGSVAATLPIGLVIGLLEWSWFGVPLTLPRYVQALPTILPLSGIFCVISYLAMSGDGIANATATRPDLGPEPEAAQNGVAPSAGRPSIPLLDRLQPGNRGPLRHISVEDHYCRIRTARGSELILLRFSDALRELGDADGLQVHRSHWVAREFVSGYRSTHGTLSLVLTDDTRVPVSRTHAEMVRGQFARIGNGNTQAD